MSKEEFEANWLEWRRGSLREALNSSFRGGSKESGVRAFLTEYTSQDIDKAIELYRQSTKLVFPQECDQLLQDLRDRSYRLACFTNEEPQITEYLKLFRLLDFFECVIFGGEDAPPKPQPDGFKLIADEMEVTTDQILHIGSDLVADVYAADSAGVASLLYDPENELSQLFADEDLSRQKVISLERLRESRLKADVRVVKEIKELSEVFQ